MRKRSEIVALAVWGGLLTSGCLLERRGYGGSELPDDGAVPPRDSGTDANAVTQEDASMDAGIDSGAADVGPPDAGCHAMSETCNGQDQDCDGRIDEGTTCACSGPPAMERVDVVIRERHSYLFCVNGTNASWTTARQLCEAQGYHLVTIEDDAENTFVRSEATQRRGVPTDDVWIGLNDLMVEGVMVWADGTPLRPADYAAWAWNQPDNYGPTGEDCVNIQSYSPPAFLVQWNDAPCVAQFPFVCEASAAPVAGNVPAAP